MLAESGCDAFTLARMGLWVVLAAPLMASCDLASMPTVLAKIFTNKEVIAIDQDARGGKEPGLLCQAGMRCGSGNSWMAAELWYCSTAGASPQ